MADYLRQGVLLLTPQTSRWPLAIRNLYHYEEQCMAFKNFHNSDNGRSREYVRSFKNPEECARFVEEHNAKIS